jgi:hypothetical protein
VTPSPAAQTDRQIRAFISSTFLDMKAERGLLVTIPVASWERGSGGMSRGG